LAQLSDLLSQAMQAPPLIWQPLACAGALHTEPVQQPPLQFPELQLAQTPPLQAPVPHDEQALPPTPQAPASVCPLKHCAPEQHPAHERPSQMHWPPLQRWPSPHAAFAPHLQSPDVLSQVSALVSSHALHRPPAIPHALREN
jgi:hypothetical protein